MRLIAMLVVLGLSSPALADGGTDMRVAAATIAIAEASLLVGSIVTGTGSTISVDKTHAGRLPWFVCSYIAGAANLVMSGTFVAILAGGGSNPSGFAVAMAAGHLGLALWNLVAPSMGAPESPSVAPVVLAGKDRAGRRWAGVGLNIATW